MESNVVSAIAPLLKLYKRLLFKSIEEVSPEHFLERPGNASNPMIWVVGHLINSRAGLARILGGTVESRHWYPIFGRGALVDEYPNYPSREDLEAEWIAVSAVLMDRLGQISADELARPSPFEVPAGEQTVAGALAFLQYHETYHIGQLGYLRKHFGYSQLVG